MTRRTIPLIVVASAARGLAEHVAARLRQDGCVVYVTNSAAGCLRVATSIGPDVVLLDPALPAGLERLLHAHPVSSPAQILRLTANSIPREVPAFLHAA